MSRILFAALLATLLASSCRDPSARGPRRPVPASDGGLPDDAYPPLGGGC